MNHAKGPRIIIDFTQEIARQLTAENITSLLHDIVEKERCVDAKTAAQMLGVSVDEFRTRHAKKLPVVELGLGKKGNRYCVADIHAYKDRLLDHPKT